MVFNKTYNTVLLKIVVAQKILLGIIASSYLTAAAPAKDESINLKAAQPKKDWNFLVYMAANNNLHSFSIKNLRQMAQIGSTSNINIIVQSDGFGSSQVKRYYVEKNNLNLISTHNHAPSVTTGTPQSLYEFVQWALQTFPADKQCLVLWNHGSGIKDPSIWGKLLMSHRDEFFTFNPATGLLELNRKLLTGDETASLLKTPYELLFEMFLKERGIAFNDAFQTYITNTELRIALEKITNNILKGKKIDLVCMDACHMGMIEFASKMKNSVDFMVASPEVEPGSGYRYDYVLEPFLSKTLSSESFARHVVASYRKEYSSISGDFTQSAIKLADMNAIEHEFYTFVTLLLELCDKKITPSFASLIKSIRHNAILTTEFFDADYIDLCQFLKSLSLKTQEYLKSTKLETVIQHKIITLQKHIAIMLKNISALIIENAAGSNLLTSHGLAIYFPKQAIHGSYYKTTFDTKTRWSSFLKIYHAKKDN